MYLFINSLILRVKPWHFNHRQNVISKIDINCWATLFLWNTLLIFEWLLSTCKNNSFVLKTTLSKIGNWSKSKPIIQIKYCAARSIVFFCYLIYLTYNIILNREHFGLKFIFEIYQQCQHPYQHTCATFYWQCSRM